MRYLQEQFDDQLVQMEEPTQDIKGDERGDDESVVNQAAAPVAEASGGNSSDAREGEIMMAAL